MGWDKKGVDPSRWALEAKDKSMRVVKSAAYMLFSEIVMETPVSDGMDGYGRRIKGHTGGQLRGGWQCSIQSPSDGIGAKDTSTNKESSQTCIKIAQKLESIKGDGSIFLTNNLPYAKTAEFGWWGKWDGDSFTPANTEKVVSGFSRQAPAGMVGKNIARWQEYIDEAVTAEGGKK